MEKFKLFYSDRSPYVRKVMVTLHEVNLFENVEIVSVRTNPLGVVEDLVDVSPLGKIPTLVLPDGTNIFDRSNMLVFEFYWQIRSLFGKENLVGIKTAEQILMAF